MRTITKTRPSTTTTYVERVNRAIDHVVKHLAKPLRLSDVAKSAGLSPFHFHRVFQGVVGETLADFVKRVRLERAMAMMCHERRASLTTIALRCGFSSSSDFSRAFKQRYGSSPSTFDLNAWRDAHRTELEATVVDWAGGLRVGRLPPASNPDAFKVRIRDLPARTVAYIRVPNPYKGDAAVRAVFRLMKWADTHGFGDRQWLGYQWERPDVTALADCHYYAAVEADGFTPKGEIGRFDFPPMVVAQVEVRGGLDLELRALQWMFGSWLPRSGYVPADLPCFEAWIGRPFAHGMEYFELNAWLPIKRS